MHVGHDRDVFVDEREARDVVELLPSLIFDADAVDPCLDKPAVRALKYLHSFLLLTETLFCFSEIDSEAAMDALKAYLGELDPPARGATALEIFAALGVDDRENA